ncbi:hypothetical protein DFJ77DRAFT_464917 [Powellomyces hirtus]|nr:hypothetical protein DFJ77DRAFT_464917 [Powellomyces hirtus]
MIRRTKIKKEYYKLLEKEGGALQGGADDLYADDNVEDEGKSEIMEGTFVKPKSSREPKDVAEEEQWPRSAPPPPAPRGKSQAQQPGRRLPVKPQPHHKPNPYAKMVQAAEQRKAERQAAFDEAKRLKAEQEAGRKQYYTKRNNTRDQLQKKTRRGQPVMANQISHLLDKIQGK